ncbi:MAG TPA: DinB family protein [Terriglobales bacterium]|nr:DinB family protein [Terriglobales bacterium]
MNETAEQYIARITGFVGTDEPLSVIAATPAKLAEMVQGISDAEASFTPAPGKWSIRQQVAHLADAEYAMSTRMRWAAAEPGKAIVAFDQDKWAAAAKYHEIPLELSLATFTAARNWTLALLRGLTPAQWDGFVVHEERGKETVRHLAKMMAGHDRNHLKQIAELRTAASPTAHSARRG